MGIRIRKPKTAMNYKRPKRLESAKCEFNESFDDDRIFGHNNQKAKENLFDSYNQQLNSLYGSKISVHMQVV